MRLLQFLNLQACLVSVVYALTSNTPGEYDERLHLKPLPGRSLYAGFNFVASTPLSSYERQNFRLFPRSFGQILQHSHTSELHLRFALGRWDEETWGNRPRGGMREGGTGVELWAWLEADSQTEAEERWSSLVNSLSGLFCASLNFIEQTKTIQPILTFETESNRNSTSTLHLMHGMLPHEVVCTENLTPFLKLLPCKGKAGVASLLDGHKVFDASWQTMAIDSRSICNPDADCFIEVEQTVDMVLDLDRCARPRDDPIPRPPAIDHIACDEAKHYNAPDTCFPHSAEDKTGWSLAQIFGRSIKGSCPLGERSKAVDIVLEVPEDRHVEQSFPDAGIQFRRDLQQISYQLQRELEFDMQVFDYPVTPQNASKSLLRASRQIAGYGQERGAMHTIITNPGQQNRQIVYMESLPWFLRPYMHTMKVDRGSIQRMFYAPAVDRRKGTHLELLLDIPAQSVVDLTYDFEKAILRYTEYPPDANRGFDIAPAVIRVLPTEGENGLVGGYMRTTSLLLPLPTPDFSMPYNVIILTSTVIALGFGSIFNLLIRRFVLLTEVPMAPLAGMLANTAAKIKFVLGRAHDPPLEKEGHKRTPTMPVSCAAPPQEADDSVIRAELANSTDIVVPRQARGSKDRSWES